ncbi:MAG: hypothetical protein IPN36_01535 [Bacteroidetes bacterium]|nr:hypothetical protein [Bacteroidota bacterium]
MKMRMVWFGLLLIGMVSCKSGKTSATGGGNVEMPEEKPDPRFRKMKVIDSRDLDGCGFLLMQDDSTLFDPGVLDEKFRKDQLEVWVHFQKDKDRMSICMRGIPVTIIEIKGLDK